MNILKAGVLLGYLILLAGNPLFAQPVIDYGSNGGQYIKVNNTDIYYEEYGEGEPVLLLHGGMGSISNFRNTIPGLAKHFKLIAIDSPGHGRSESIDSLSYKILAEYTVGMVEALNLDKPHIIGYSDGAIIGMLAAHMAPDKIDKLVFGAGALNPHISTPEGLQMLQNISPETLPEDFEKSYKAKSPNPENWTNFVYASKRMWLDDVWIPKEILPKIDSEVLVLFGDRDPFIPLSHSLEIHEALPKSALCILPEVAHNVYDNPEKVNPVLVAFLSGEL